MDSSILVNLVIEGGNLPKELLLFIEDALFLLTQEIISPYIESI